MSDLLYFFFLKFPVIMCIFYLWKIYLQIINGYYKCIFISLCDCVNHQSDLWSGYWNKAVGLWLGNCKNWIRRFWACESKKKKKIPTSQQSKVHSGLVCVISGVPVRWGIPWHYTVVWHPSMMNNARLRRCAQAKIWEALKEEEERNRDCS